jgi:hypothetical protein
MPCNDYLENPQFVRGKAIVKHRSQQTLSAMFPHEENMEKITKQIGKTP